MKQCVFECVWWFFQTITGALALNGGVKPLSASDLISAISKEYKEKMAGFELEEITLNGTYVPNCKHIYMYSILRQLAFEITYKYQVLLYRLDVSTVVCLENHFTYCNDMTHTANSYCKRVFPKWKKLKNNFENKKGSPLLLVVCSAALRAAEMVRCVNLFTVFDYIMVCNLVLLWFLFNQRVLPINVAFRLITAFKGDDCKVTKLFAKHIKVSRSVDS